MKIGIGVGLLVMVLTFSKEMLVFNVETIVLLSTLLTLGLLVKYAGKALVDMLDGESQQVEEAFNQSRLLEKEMVSELKAYYALQGEVAQELGHVHNALNEQFKRWLSTRHDLFEATWTSAVEQKLQRISVLEKQAMDSFQSTFLHVFDEAVTETQWTEVSEAEVDEMAEVLSDEGYFPYWDVLEPVKGSSTSLTEYEFVGEWGDEGPEYEVLVGPVNAEALISPDYQVELYHKDDFYA